MDTIHITNKGRRMDTLERFYIYRETKYNNQLNDRLTAKPSAIFEAVVHEDSNRGHTTHGPPTHNSVVRSYPTLNTRQGSSTVKGCSVLYTSQEFLVILMHKPVSNIRNIWTHSL
jgi:hypothetical protein